MTCRHDTGSPRKTRPVLWSALAIGPTAQETPVVARSPDRATLLWHGLLTVPLPPTEGLHEPVEHSTGPWRPSVRLRGTVRRPCHNEECHNEGWHGQETVPQRGETVPQRGPDRSKTLPDGAEYLVAVNRLAHQAVGAQRRRP